MNIFNKSIVCIIFFQILLLLIGCNSNVTEMNEIAKEEVVLKVEGIEIAHKHYNERLEHVKRGLIQRKNHVENSEFKDPLIEKLFEVEKKYNPKTITLAHLVLDNVMFSEAQRVGITVSEQEVQELINKAKHGFSNEEIPQFVKDFIKREGEEYYWETYLPKFYSQSLYIRKFLEKISQEEDVTSVQISLVKEAEIEIVNNELFDRSSIIEAIKYLEDSLVL